MSAPRSFQPRICCCTEECRQEYIPTSAAQKMAPGHKRGVGIGKQPPPKPLRQTPKLDFQLALQTAEREMQRLVGIIDEADDEIEGFRAAIDSLQILKDQAVERHALTVECIGTLKRLIETAT